MKTVNIDEVTLATSSYQLIRKDLGLEEEMVFTTEENAFDRLEKFLEKAINYLLDHDFNRLLNALYRIDIPESQVNELLQRSSADQLALEIAKAVIEREKQKVITREQYRSH